MEQDGATNEGLKAQGTTACKACRGQSRDMLLQASNKKSIRFRSAAESRS